MPTLPFNDLVIHPRDNDLVLGTHGRGVWILDQINALQELSEDVVGKSAHLFTIGPAVQIRRAGRAAHTGDVHYRGENPPLGAIIDYWLGETAGDGTVEVAIQDSDGDRVATVTGTTRQGMNRVVWDMRHQLDLGGDAPTGPFQRPVRGPLVVPGTYTARLEVAGQGGAATDPAADPAQEFTVREDPRIGASIGVRAAWTGTLLELAGTLAQTNAGLAGVNEALEGVADDDTGPRAMKLRDLAREFGELASRIGRLSGEVEGVVAPLTQDQRSRRDFYMEMLEVLTAEAAAAANPQ
jgi:hypothetical protein